MAKHRFIHKDGKTLAPYPIYPNEVRPEAYNNLKINKMKTGIELIAQERQEQIEKHGFNTDHDKQNTNYELGHAAIFMLTGKPTDYPKTWSKEWFEKLNRKGYKESLIIAGAFIAAEIDRVQEIEKSMGKPVA